ncbi:MAG: cupin domain-containing protein [Oligoflexia bacterium]|nr:cupin domain-containing protein [Oligoflexia bacterium]MBF0364616.1 cupin domain-containing protein [Oligoflexia bacterium]
MEYDIKMTPVYGSLEKISIADAKKLSNHPWFNRTLCEVNESVVRIGVFNGEFHWHSHDKEDEFFFVIEGTLAIEVENKETIELKANEGTVIPKGVRHRPLAAYGATVLMVESKSIAPIGDER